MPQIRLLTSMSGPDRTYRRGQIVDRRPGPARKLVRAGFAEYVDPADAEDDPASSPPTVSGSAGGTDAAGSRAPSGSQSGTTASGKDLTETPLAELGLEKKDRELLVAGGLTTVEAVETHEDLTELAGIGKVARDRIRDAVAAFRS